LNWRQTFVATAFLSVLILTHCKGQDTSQGVPGPATPNPNQTSITAPSPTPNPLLPNLSVAEIIRDWPNYIPAIEQMFGVPSSQTIILPQATFSLSATGNMTGNGTFEIETNADAYFFTIPLFYGTWDGTNLYAIFADDTSVILMQGSIQTEVDATGPVLNCNIYNHERQSGDLACKTECINGQCTYNGYSDPSILSQCQTYMTIGNASVQQVGRIEKAQPNISDWIN